MKRHIKSYVNPHRYYQFLGPKNGGYNFPEGVCFVNIDKPSRDYL